MSNELMTAGGHRNATGSIFINYRSMDSQGYGSMLYLELCRHFGGSSVFLDSESIPAGIDYVHELTTEIDRARAMLAVIGPHWLKICDSHGRRLIDRPDDWVRRELSAALAMNTKVVPVLVDGATLPASGELPADIQALSRRQYRTLRHREAAMDIALLVQDLLTDPYLATAASEHVNRSHGRRFRLRRPSAGDIHGTANVVPQRTWSRK